VIDSLRLRVRIARRIGVSPQSVEANVVGEHGVSEVMLWSSARVAGVPLQDVCTDRAESFASLRASVEHAVRYANISIVEGNNASQHGIGMAAHGSRRPSYATNDSYSRWPVTRSAAG